jgi:PAS domain S-box-containing protein
MKITIIAPMATIVGMTHEVLQKYDFGPGVEIEVFSGLLEAGLDRAMRAVKKGTDVIISRGGTASLISRHVDIPVVEIQVDALDILRALKSLGDVSGPVGVVFGRRVLFECEKLGELIGVALREIHLGNEAFEEKITAASREGIHTFLGDALTIRLFQERGMRVFPIESSMEAIRRAITEAVSIGRVRRREQEKAELFRTIVNAAAEGIIAVDQGGQITLLNQAAEGIFNLQGTNAIGKSLEEIFPDEQLRRCLDGERYEGTGIKTVGEKILAVKRVPIVVNRETVGVIAHLQDVTQLQNFEQVVRQKLNQKGLVAKFHIEQLVGSSAAMTTVKQRIRQYAALDGTVLITGESGTGKERVAQSIHNLSGRRNSPFIAVNCAALPEQLLESELFGYVEGAFTGARKGGKAGLFELAHGGTLLLDEIGEMPLPLQARLLRVLQEKEVMRLGADRVIPVNVRIISSTNQDLGALVEKKKFRADLYFRLDVFRLYLPPLRERTEDIPELVRALLKKTPAFPSEITDITPDALAFLKEHPWRGNIRELENVIERVRLLSTGPLIEPKDIQNDFPPDSLAAKSVTAGDNLADWERKKIEAVLWEEKFNYTRTARRLGMNRTTLWRKIRQWEKGTESPL